MNNIRLAISIKFHQKSNLLFQQEMNKVLFNSNKSTEKKRKKPLLNFMMIL